MFLFFHDGFLVYSLPALFQGMTHILSTMKYRKEGMHKGLFPQADFECAVFEDFSLRLRMGSDIRK